MRFNTLAVRASLFAFAVGAALAGCKSSSSTTGGGSSDGGDSLRTAAAKRQSINHLLQIGVAVHNHHDNFGFLPTAGLPKGAKAPPGFYPPHSWRVQILPYIEQQNLWNTIPMGGMGPLPEMLPKTAIKVYQNPLGGGQPTDTPYRVFVGNGAAFEYGQKISFPAGIPDGTSNTILVVEAAEPVNWASLDELTYDPKKPLPKLGIFDGGFHALMADGSVRWIPSDADEKMIRLAITRADGLPFEMPGKRVDKDE